jgi:hypothetical protein
MRKHMNKSIVVAVALACVLAALPCAADESVAVGSLESGAARFQGGTIAAGATLRGAGLLQTGAEPAVVHLANGRRVEVAEHSVLQLALPVDDSVEVTVLRGQIIVEDGAGKRLSGGEKARFVLRPTTLSGAARDEPDFGDDDTRPRRPAPAGEENGHP